MAKANGWLSCTQAPRNGWVDGAALVFNSKQHSDKYHNEMNHQKFEESFTTALLPKLSPNSIIVIDNALYQSRRKEPIPTKSWTKVKMKVWLSCRGIAYPKKCKKCDIWEMVQKYRPKCPTCIFDEVA